MSLKPPEQFRHPKNLVMIRLNIMLVKRVRTKSLELKPFLLPSYSFRRAGMVHASPQYPDNILFNTFQEDTSPHMRRILIQVPMAVFWLIYQQVPKVTEDLLTAGWSTGTERDPFPALSGDQQSWQQIASLGYCWSGPDLSDDPKDEGKKKSYILYLILLTTQISTRIHFKHTCHLNDTFIILMLPPLFLFLYPLATFPNVTSMKDEHTPHRALQGHHTDRWMRKELPGKPGKILFLIVHSVKAMLPCRAQIY